LVVDQYVNNSFQLITRETWADIYRQTFHREPTYNALSLLILNANRELAALLETNERVILKAGIYGRGGWRLDPRFFDLPSMPRTVRGK